MKGLCVALCLSFGALHSYEITRTHALAVATSALWTIAPRVSNEYVRFEYELCGMITGVLALIHAIAKNKQPLEASWKPSPIGFASVVTASFLIALRNKSPLPYTIAAIALLRDFQKKDVSAQQAYHQSPVARDLHYWIGIGLATGAFTIYQSVADALCITDQAARGGMLTLSAIFVADALQKQYGM